MIRRRATDADHIRVFVKAARDYIARVRDEGHTTTVAEVEAILRDPRRGLGPADLYDHVWPEICAGIEALLQR